MQTCLLAALLLLGSTNCLADRRLLHGGHAHEEEAQAAATSQAGAPTEGHADGTWLDFINSTGHSDPTDYIVDALAGNPDALNGGNMSEILYVVGNSQNATARPVLGELPPGHIHLSSATLLKAYGTNGTLNATGLQQAFAAIISCQLVMINSEAQSAQAPAQPASDDASQPKQDINWLKAVAAVVLFFEAMLGVSLPLLRRVSFVESAFQRGLMSVLNCFAGGVFITFGIMHLLLHVIGAQADSNYTAYFPIGVFFIVLGFMLFFFIQRVLGPLLTPAGAQQGGSCCASAMPAQVNAHKEGMEVNGASGVDGKGCPCPEQASCNTPPAQRMWVSFISPSLLLFAMCIHGIFEGLTLGLQDTKVGAVTVLVALVCHKWVESLALSARCLKIGANWWQTATFLLPFALTAPLGVGIGAALSNVNPWAQMVLYALATGFFIYVGACEVIGEEFAYGASHSRGFRALLFLAAMLGFTLVALLQLIHDGD